MQWTANQLENFDDDDAEEQWTPNDHKERFPDVSEFSAQLHATLISLVEGEGFDIVVGVVGCCEMEARRKLTRRYDPKVAGRSKNMLKNVLNPLATQSVRHAFRHGALGTALPPIHRSQRAGWQKKRTSRRHPHGHAAGDGPPELRTHLYLNSQKCTSHAVVRSEVVSCLEAKVGARLHKDDPMEVVTVAKEDDKGKRKGKSRDGKVEGKDKETEKHDRVVKFKDYCSNPNCGKWSHKWTDCWKERGGEGKDKVKGKGKPNKNVKITVFSSAIVIDVIEHCHTAGAF